MITRQFLMEFGHPAALLYLFTKPLSLPRRNENKSRQGGNKGQGLPRLRRNKMENVERKKVERERARRLLQNRTQWSGGPVSVFLAAPNFCSAVCFQSTEIGACLQLTSQSLVRKTVQMLQSINRWRAATGLIRRYGSLMRPGRSTPPIYTCFDPSGERGGGDRKVLSAKCFSFAAASACVASSQ